MRSAHGPGRWFWQHAGDDRGHELFDGFRLPRATLQDLLDGSGAAADAAGGGFIMHYATLAVSTARTGPA